MSSRVNCGLRAENLAYFRLTRSDGSDGHVIRQCCEYSIAEVIDENGDLDLLAKDVRRSS